MKQIQNSPHMLAILISVGFYHAGIANQILVFVILRLLYTYLSGNYTTYIDKLELWSIDIWLWYTNIRLWIKGIPKTPFGQMNGHRHDRCMWGVIAIDIIIIIVGPHLLYSSSLSLIYTHMYCLVLGFGYGYLKRRFISYIDNKYMI